VNSVLKGKKILVTAGPTHEYLDDIRFIGNRSSGRQGIEIARCLHDLKADITLVVGPVNLDLSGLRKVVRVETALQMYNAVMKEAPFDIAICTAAVGDWRPKKKAKTKIKKNSSGEPPNLDLIENPDILRNIAESKNRPNLVIGFAAETANLLKNARLKLKNKRCDWIIANKVNSKNSHMGGEENEVIIVKKNEEIQLKRQSKKNIARFLCNEIVQECSG
jgi:phosphopantothenoylcysteine decarboxylase/phosphopantothenate--cysteine ligase